MCPTSAGRRVTAGNQRKDGDDVTGTKDKNYNLIWYTEKCLDNALRPQTYIHDAERDGDQEVADLFRKARAERRKGAEIAERLRRDRL